MHCDVKPSEVKESAAAARALETDEEALSDEDEPPCMLGALALLSGSWSPLELCRRNWRALARAFSCVRTNCARFYGGSSASKLL